MKYFVNKMQRKMQNYHPGKIKRVYIDLLIKTRKR